jgi:hypothetical protein
MDLIGGGTWRQRDAEEIGSPRDVLLAGELLLQSARLVGDPQDLLVWRIHRVAWLQRAAAATSWATSSGTAGELAGVSEPNRPASEWVRAFEAERSALERTLAAIAARCCETDR